MFTHLPTWIVYLELCLGCKLEPDDYNFPYFGPNGILQPKQEMTHDMVQSLLNKFTSGTGLSKSILLTVYTEVVLNTVSCLHQLASGSH